MKIMHTSSNEVVPPVAKRRYYSPELKVQVVQECRQAGASIARVALAHGINANIVHRWIHEEERSALLLRAKSFLPVTLGSVVTPRLAAVVDTPAPMPDIRVQIQRGASAITVNWPLDGAAACASWLQELLR